MSLPTVPDGLIVTPGASADRDHRTLVAIEQGVPELAVVRLTLATTSVDRAAAKIVDASATLADDLGVPADRIALGGRSFGGRACSVAVSRGLAAAGLALLSYPLHPPGKPERLRVDHFPEIDVPVLFVSGSRDPFGSPDEFDEHVDAVAGPVDIRWVDGGHSPTDDDVVVEHLRDWLGL